LDFDGKVIESHVVGPVSWEVQIVHSGIEAATCSARELCCDAGVVERPDRGFAELLSRRLRLRRFRDVDLDAFVAYRDDPDTARYQGWETPYGAQQGAAFLALMKTSDPDTPGAWFQFAIELHDRPGLIGDVAVHVRGEDPDVAEIGVTLPPAARKKGYGTEALNCLLQYLFDTRAKREVVANCDHRNTAVIALLERLGFVRAATALAADGSHEHVYVLNAQRWRRRDRR
jgi:RimJ/RimL family protein N-acetyltransferase